MRVLSVIGTRPQYIKLSAVSKELRKVYEEILVDTGQHYDFEMSGVFIRQLQIPKADYQLGVGSGSHAEQTGRILIELEKVLLKLRPDRVIVYGDTNSTLAGALAAAKLALPLAHIEAGPRNYDRSIPEEINRVVADHLSDLLFCSTERDVRNLEAEGVQEGVHLVGDVMCDSLLDNLPRAETASSLLSDLGLKPGGYLLLTLHRPANVDELRPLASVIEALGHLDERILFPVHPRTRKSLEDLGHTAPQNFIMSRPLGYLEMLMAEKNARCIVTDSGGVQKEAYIVGVPCVTCLERTPWQETVDAGWNVLVSNNPTRLLEAVRLPRPRTPRPPAYGDGKAARRIVQLL